jgi:hypothetical protein
MPGGMHSASGFERSSNRSGASRRWSLSEKLKVVEESRLLGRNVLNMLLLNESEFSSLAYVQLLLV